MIVVEGPDGAGKTTLVDHLTKKYDLPVGERAVGDRDLLYTVTVHDTYRALSLDLQPGGDCYVWDRLFFSEFVYAPVMGREVVFSNYQATYITEVMNALRTVVIVCLPYFSTCIDNVLHERHQMEGVRENVTSLWKSYRALTLLDDIHTIPYNYEVRGDLFVVEQSVEAHLLHRREIA